MQVDGNQYNLKTVNLGYDSAEAAEVSNELDTDGFNGLAVCVAFESALSQDETITFTLEADSGTTSGFSPSYSTVQAATVVATGANGGSTESGTATVRIDLSDYERYAKFRTTMATSSGSDNIDYNVVAILTDPEVKPYTDGTNAQTLIVESTDIS